MLTFWRSRTCLSETDDQSKPRLCGEPPSEHVHEISIQPLHAAKNRQENIYFEETEDTQSNDLKNNNTWLITAKNISELENKKRQQTRCRRIKEPDTTASNNTTSPAATTTTKTQCSWVDIGIQLLAKFLHRGFRAWSTCVEWRTHYAVCSVPHTRTNVPVTTSQRTQIQHQFERLMKRSRICHSFRFFTQMRPWRRS